MILVLFPEIFWGIGAKQLYLKTNLSNSTRINKSGGLWKISNKILEVRRGNNQVGGHAQGAVGLQVLQIQVLVQVGRIQRVETTLGQQVAG